MFCVLERLKRLRAGLPITPPETGTSTYRKMVSSSGEQITLTSWTDLPGDWMVEFEERAAVREFEGGQVREHAEAEAMEEIIVRMQRGGWRPA